MGSSIWDPRTIVATVAAIAAVVSAIVAVISALTTRRSLGLAQEQDARRKPRIVSYLRDGYARRDRDRRRYAVSLSLTNPSDSDNSIAMLELEIHYRSTDSRVMTMRLPHEQALQDGFGLSGTQALALPVRIPAHGTIAGWTFFDLPVAAVGGGEIDDYFVRLVDAHGIATMVELGPMREIGNASPNDD